MTTEEIKEIEERFNHPDRQFRYFAHKEFSDKLLTEVKKLRWLLDTALEYMFHSPNCSKRIWNSQKCDCGFIEAKKQIEEETK